MMPVKSKVSIQSQYQLPNIKLARVCLAKVSSRLRLVFSDNEILGSKVIDITSLTLDLYS